MMKDALFPSASINAHVPDCNIEEDETTSEVAKEVEIPVGKLVDNQTSCEVPLVVAVLAAPVPLATIAVLVEMVVLRPELTISSPP
jgi:hypothetical protein